MVNTQVYLTLVVGSASCFLGVVLARIALTSNDNASMSHNWGPSSHQFSLGTGHCQHFCHGFFWILNFETHKRKISHSCVEFLELRLDMFGSSTLEKLVNKIYKILQLTLGSFLDDVSLPAMS